MSLVKLIGSEWDGSRIPAPKRDIPEYGVKLKLKGRNFRVKRLDNGELVAYYLGELADDIVGSFNDHGLQDFGGDALRRYDICETCNYDRHQCPGCGTELSHDGIDLSDGPRRGYSHGSSCVE